MIKDIDKLITELTPAQKEYLLAKLKSAVFGGISKDVIQCPCCNDKSFIKYGSYKETVKYKCKTTKKIFSYKSKSMYSIIILCCVGVSIVSYKSIILDSDLLFA